MRIAAIIVLVLVLDAFVFVCGRVLTMEANQMEIMRALRAQSDTPSPEADRRVDAAFATARSVRARGDQISLGVILLITFGGVAAMKRSPASNRPSAATINT